MLTALAPQALPGLLGRLPAAAAQRQDSSGSSGSYYTAPGSPEPPDVGPDAEGRESWPWVAPEQGAGAQPRLSISAQNSRQRPGPSSGFPRGRGSGPRPPQPQLRTLPSGEMEVIFSAGPLFSPSDATDREVQQLTAPTFRSFSPPGPTTPALAPPHSQDPDCGSRWATYLELQPHGPNPNAPAQFECVEVALEERAAPARPRTVPKRQIELRPRPLSPPRTAEPLRPRLLLRTGSLDESLGRLQAAAGLVQTALARKLSPAAPAPSSAASGPSGRPEPATRETARSARGVQEEARSRPPRVHDSSLSARAPKPWPSLRERAIRRDKPAPGTEPLGPVSSSIFLQSGEKTQEVRNPETKTQFPREIPSNRSIRRAESPSFETRVPWDVPNRAVVPRSPSQPQGAANGIARGPHHSFPQAPSHWAVGRARSPSFPEAPFTPENGNPTVEETVSGRSPSPATLSQWDQGVARTRSPSLEAPPFLAHQAVGGTAGDRRSRSPPALSPWEVPDRPLGEPCSLSPQKMWHPTVQDSSVASTQGLNGAAQEQRAASTPSTPGTPEPTEVQSPSTRDIPDLAFPGREPSPEVAAPEPSRSRLAGALDPDARPEPLGPGEVASGRPRVAIPRPCDVRKMVKTTYAPTFPAGTPGSGLPVPPADPRGEEGGSSEMQELQAPGSPAPAHYTSIFLKDFLPVVPHPYDLSEPSPNPDTVPRDASQPTGVPRRRAENSTAKPFARTEIRLPGALALGRRPEGAPGVRVCSAGGAKRDAEAPRLVPEGEGRTSPLGGARTSPQRLPKAPAGAPPPLLSSPQAHPSSSPGIAPKPETRSAAREPAPAVQPPLGREPPEPTGRAAPPPPRAASAPPTDRPREGPPRGARRPHAAAQPGKVLVDPESGRYYFVEAPRQPRLRLLFDPESGQYVEVLLPPSPPGPPRRVYTPLALGPGLYPPAYGPVPGLSLPPSPGPPALSSPQPPWASEAGPLDGMYYLPVSGTPGPAPHLLLCAPPSPSGPSQPGKGSLFPLGGPSTWSS
ncbi:proline-rich basic protein 1 [Dasypus novemcinctus]|uniref:proline-rich basic protein 1 n=1 Tax=Dasypus novemcinctus TaxID=9361 RepID=UPI00265F14E6|nr:proline-rich basic protein 1 [Dasypus novemcinctus]